MASGITPHAGNLSAIVSTRLVYPGYAGPLLRGYIGGVEKDVFSDGDGKLSASSPVEGGGTLAAWAGSATVYVTVWYDQTLAAGHLTQTNPAKMPSCFVSGAVPVSPNGEGKPAIRVFGTQWMAGPVSVTIKSVHITVEYADAFASIAASANNYLAYKTGGRVYFANGGGAVNGLFNSAVRQYVVQFGDASGANTIYLMDKTVILSGTTLSKPGVGVPFIGANGPNGTTGTNGWYSEFGIWSVGHPDFNPVDVTNDLWDFEGLASGPPADITPPGVPAGLQVTIL